MVESARETQARPLAKSTRAFTRRTRSKIEGRIVRWVFFSCAMVSVLTTIGIVVSLLSQAMGFFFEVSLWEFLTGTRWTR